MSVKHVVTRPDDKEQPTMNKRELEEFETNVVEICSKAALNACKEFQAAGYELSGVELKRYGMPSDPNYQSELILTIYQQADGKGNLIPVDWIEELICLDGVPRYTLDGIKEWIDEQLQNSVSVTTRQPDDERHVR